MQQGSGAGKPSMMDKAKGMVQKLEEKLPGHHANTTATGTHPASGGTTATGVTSSTTTGAHPTHQHATYGTTVAPIESGVTHSTTPTSHVVGTHATTHMHPTMMDQAKHVICQAEAKLPGHHAGQYATTGQYATGVHDTGFTGSNTGYAAGATPGHSDPHDITGFSGTGATTGTHGLASSNTTYGTGTDATHLSSTQYNPAQHGVSSGTGAHTGATHSTMMDKVKNVIGVENRIPDLHGAGSQPRRNEAAGHGAIHLGQSSDTYTPHHGGI